MSDRCDDGCDGGRAAIDPRFRRVLQWALAINAVMFVVEIAGGVRADSSALLADAVDFFGDAANYALSLTVLALGALARARAALAKGLTMAAYGVFVVGRTAWAWAHGIVPEPAIMGAVAALALAANLGVAAMLYRFRDGDANQRSVWICSRNDALGNIAVMAAALGVLGTAHGWPDFVVAAFLAALALSGGIAVSRQALAEIRSARLPQPAA